MADRARLGAIGAAAVVARATTRGVLFELFEFQCYDEKFFQVEFPSVECFIILVQFKFVERFRGSCHSWAACPIFKRGDIREWPRSHAIYAES